MWDKEGEGGVQMDTRVKIKYLYVSLKSTPFVIHQTLI